MRLRRSIVFAVAGVLVLGGRPAHAQATITAGDDVTLRFGVLGQFWADSVGNPSDDTSTRNLFVRRLRIITGGQVATKVSFFVETDAPNLGRTVNGKNITPSVIVQDAFASFAPTDAFIVDAGLLFVPFSRNSVQSAATLLPIDYGVNTFTQSGPTQSSTGRDTGFQARGYLLASHLEYRIGAFQGARDPASHNGLRYAGRLQFEFFDPEVGFFYTGTYLGKKRVAAVGAAFDSQEGYHAFDADAFVDLPFWVGAFTGQFDYNRFNGGTFLTTLPRLNTYLAEAGVLVAPAHLTPFVQWTNRSAVDASTTPLGIVPLSLADEHRASVGAAYWWAGHNANVKAAYTHIASAVNATQHEFTLQLQLFYF